MVIDYTQYEGTPDAKNAAARVDALLKRTCEFCQVTGTIDVPVTTAGYMGSTTIDTCHACVSAIVQAWPGLAAEIQRTRALLAIDDDLGDGLADALQDTGHALAEVTEERDRLRAELAELRAEPRDDYHTMAELYEYRMLYNAHAAHGWLAAGIPVVKSWRHHDFKLCFGGGWFIVTAQLPTGQVSNHYKADHWDLFDVPEVWAAPEWDGHTPADAADRLRAALKRGTDV